MARFKVRQTMVLTRDVYVEATDAALAQVKALSVAVGYQPLSMYGLLLTPKATRVELTPEMAKLRQVIHGPGSGEL